METMGKTVKVSEKYAVSNRKRNNPVKQPNASIVMEKMSILNELYIDYRVLHSSYLFII